MQFRLLRNGVGFVVELANTKCTGDRQHAC